MRGGSKIWGGGGRESNYFSLYIYIIDLYLYLNNPSSHQSLTLPQKIDLRFEI